MSGSVLASFLYIFCSEWWLRFLDSGALPFGNISVPFFRNGFRMVVFSVIIMIIVLFFRRGIMGTNEFSDLINQTRRKAKTKKEAAE